MQVRPSGAERAEYCLRAAYLSAKFPASRANTRKGSEVDGQVSFVLKHGLEAFLATGEELAEESGKMLEWLEANYPAAEWRYFVQEKVALLDPETDRILTEGTPDLMCFQASTGWLVDIDWKSKGQMWAGHLSAPERNLQQLIYLSAYWLQLSREHKITQAKIVLACWDTSGVTPQETQEPIGPDVIMGVVERMRKMPEIDPAGPEPEAHVGDHCQHCWQRMHCTEHLLPAGALIQKGQELPPFLAAMVATDQLRDKQRDGAILDAGSTVQALAWVEQARRVLREAGKIVDLVEENCDAFVILNGPVESAGQCYGPATVKGKQLGATVATLKMEGLQRLIRPAKDSVKCKWYPGLKPGREITK
jgi:hypothetical protein